MQSPLDSAGLPGSESPGAAAASPFVNIALRALDTSLAASQHMIERADRLARAGAGAPAEAPATDQPVGPAVWGGGRAALAYGLAMASAMQRSTITLLADSWRQWLNAVGAMASLATRAQPATAQESSVATWSEPRHATAAGERRAPRRAQRQRGRAPGEHATAAATKRRAGRKPAARRRST